MRFDPKAIEDLLYEHEGRTIDFKKKHYAILSSAPKAGDAQHAKGEFLKDIVAFANSADDAHIIVGADPTQRDESGRVKVLGDPLPDFDEAQLQSLVNDNVNRPIRFEYSLVNVKGGQLGIFRIPKQERPIYLKQDVGHIRGNLCYCRQGGRTVSIPPDELIASAKNEAIAAKRPAATIEFGDKATRETGTTAKLLSRLLRTAPSASPEGPVALEKFRNNQTGLGVARKADQTKVEAFLTQQRRLSPLGIRVENIGAHTLEHARLSLSFAAFSDIGAGLEVVEKYKLLERPVSLMFIQPSISESNVSVTAVPSGWEVTVHVGRVVPHQDFWSDPFWIGAKTHLIVPVRARLVADGLSPPIEQQLTIEIETNFAPLDAEVRAFRAEEKKW